MKIKKKGDPPKRKKVNKSKKEKEREKARQEIKKANKIKKKVKNFLQVASLIEEKQSEMDTTTTLPSEEENESNKAIEVEDLISFQDCNLGPPSIPKMRNFRFGIEYRKIDGSSVLFSMAKNCQLIFSGKFIIIVLKGTVEINGSLIKYNSPNSGQIVISSKGHSSLLSIDCLDEEGIRGDIENITPNVNVTHEELDDLLGAVFILKGFENDWTMGFRKYFSEASALIGPEITGLGPLKKVDLESLMQKLGFKLFRSPNWKDNLRLFKSEKSWENTFELLKGFNGDMPKFAFFGGKGVGKSTICRWMTNKFLNCEKEILFIDLDPGQTEFNPPGIISVSLIKKPILGPNFSHLQTPSKQFYIGDINIANCPLTYLDAICFLFKYISENEKLRNCPWLINTMGFCRGLGVELSCEIIRIFQPDIVIQISINNSSRSYPFDLNTAKVNGFKRQMNWKPPSDYNILQECKNYQLIKIESVCQIEESNVKKDKAREKTSNQWGSTPKILREIVIVSYFAELLGKTEECSLLSIVPYFLSLDKVAIGTMGTDLKYEGILRTINGNLVALFKLPSSAFLKEISGEHANKNYIQTAKDYINREESEFFGYGLVRSMDMIKGQIHLISPVSSNLIMDRVNCVIAAGTIGLPTQFYTNPGSLSTSDMPYVMNSQLSNTKLHVPTKRTFIPNRIAHPSLKNSRLPYQEQYHATVF